MIDVEALAYKPGWKFKLGGPGHSMLCVYSTTPDSTSPARNRWTQHQFELPADDLSIEDWQRWVFERLLEVELHEAGEFFTYAGQRPFFPHHQDEGSPYTRVERFEEQPC